MANVLKFHQDTQECELHLGVLYADRGQRERFETRWSQFLKSDSANQAVFWREGSDRILYRTESFTTGQRDDRPPVLLLLGNPASHSVAAGMCFAFEGHGREHRFWAALRKAGILEFFSDRSASRLSWPERNTVRKEELRSLQYLSPFRVGIAVYFSMPSSASSPLWSGVAGLSRLFGRKALQAMIVDEQVRIATLLQGFLNGRGGIIAFQKDAYAGVCALDAPQYSIGLALQGSLVSRCRYGSDISLTCGPPTRLLHSRAGQRSLERCKDYLNNSLRIVTAGTRSLPFEAVGV